MKKIITLAAILFAFINNTEAQNFQVTDPPNYPYGIDIKTTYGGQWAREFSFSRSGTNKLLSFGALGNGDNLVYGYIGGSSVSGASNNNAWMTFLATGNVGIGTTTPQYKLHVGAGKNDGILIGNYNDGLGWDGTGEQPGFHIRFAGYRDVRPNFTGARISALRTNACCNALSTGMELAFYTTLRADDASGGDANLVEALRIKSDGKIGIGTSVPQELLDVNGRASIKQNLLIKNNGVNSSEILMYKQDQTNYYDIVANATGWSLYNSSTAKYPIYITANDNVGIGTILPAEKLSVDGNIRSRKVIVTQTGWPDYVFDSSYLLPSLDSVSSFIQVNKHLPDMPSAAVVEKDGHDLGEVQKQLLKKVEELTLYVIELKKENEAQQKEINLLKEKK